MICLDPEQRIRVVLASDESRPDSEQPTLLYRAMTVREFRHFQAVIDKSDLPNADQLSVACEAAQCNLVGWKNISREFNATELDDILTPHEVEEVIVKLFRVMRFTANDKKKLDSPQPSGTDKSAEPASLTSVSTAPV